MKQAVLIPWHLIDRLVSSNDPDFYVWLIKADSSVFLMLKRPEGMTPEAYGEIGQTVLSVIETSPKGFVLYDDGFVHKPDLEINTDLEHVVDLLNHLERGRASYHTGGGEYMLPWIGAVLDAYFEKLYAYLEPYFAQEGVNTNQNILPEERKRYLVARLVLAYKDVFNK